MSNLNHDLLLSIECPACLDYMARPIYLCVRGHSVCSACRNILNRCPVCRYVVTNSRNFKLEEIADFLSYPCANSDDGCEQYLTKHETEDHKLVCHNRNYHCQIKVFGDECVWSDKRKNFMEHVVNNHLAHEEYLDTIYGMKFYWSEVQPNYIVQMIIIFEEMFYIHRKLVRQYEDAMMYFAIQYIGKPEDTIQYFYKFQIYTEEYENRCIKYYDNLHDDLLVIDEMIESGHCVAIPMSVFDTFKDRRGHVCYIITIKKA